MIEHREPASPTLRPRCKANTLRVHWRCMHLTHCCQSGVQYESTAGRCIDFYGAIAAGPRVLPRRSASHVVGVTLNTLVAITRYWGCKWCGCLSRRRSRRRGSPGSLAHGRRRPRRGEGCAHTRTATLDQYSPPISALYNFHDPVNENYPAYILFYVIQIEAHVFRKY